MKKRSRRKRLETWLTSANTPVFLLDASRKVVFFNSGCEELTGWSAEEVVGEVCDYASEADNTQVESITGHLCPPPEVLEGTEQSVPAYLVHRSGRSVARLLNFFPLTNENGRVKTVLGVITPIRRPPLSMQKQTSPAQQLHAELASLRNQLRQRFGLKGLICRSDSMNRVLEQVNLACRSKSPILLEGEEGTGKEHLARVIHYEGENRNRSFVPLNCRQLPSFELKQAVRRLLERDEADSSQVPILQPGTLYLCHVENFPRDLQEYLLEFFRLSGSGNQPSLRLIASSTQDLQQAVEEDRLREDFYYLLTVLKITLPPLHSRKEELMPFAQHFLESGNRQSDRQIGGFTEEVQEQFREYNWPGNLDELAAVVEESRETCNRELIGLENLPFRFRTGRDAQSVGPRVEPTPIPLEYFLNRVEKEQIQLALEQSGYNKSKAAELLQITRARLYRRMQALEIEDWE